MTSVKTEIDRLLRSAFLPKILEITDDSKRHQGHREAGEGQESHFTLVMVSVVFEGKTSLQRHRLVHEILKPLLLSHIHALSLKLGTPCEYQMKREEVLST